jgi:hypothetical protein
MMPRVKWLAAALAAVAAGTVVAGSQAGPPQPGQWRQDYWQTQTPVEQQTVGGANQPDPALWVVNPTRCVWDSDDTFGFQFYGALEPGQSASISTCLVGDWHEHISRVYWASDGLDVTVRVAGTAAAGDTGACVLGPDYDHETTKLPPVEGSNGGVGVATEVTFTATNTSRKTVRRGLAYGYVGPWYSNSDPCHVGPRFGFDPAWRTGHD